MRRKVRRRVKWKNLFLLLVIVLVIIVFGVMGIFFNSNDKDGDTKVMDGKVKSQDREDSLDDKSRDLDKEESLDKVNSDLKKAPDNYLEFLEKQDGDYVTSKGYTLTIRDGVAYVDGILIVNKTYSVPSSYVPVNSSESISGDRCNNCLNEEVMKAFGLMKSDATGLGLNLYIASGYRSYAYQERLYNNYVSVSGKEGADTYSARPGHSEHQTGTCFDLNTVDDSFANTSEGRWVNENAYLYGFIIRYPKGKETLTGYQYESWHLRYVGVDLAKKLYNNGNWITLEEYYGISSNYG